MKPLVVRNGQVAQIRTSETLNVGSVAVGVDNLDDSAIVEISGQGGILVPRMDTEARDSIIDPANGLLIYNIETGTHEQFVTDEGWKNMGGLPDVIDCGEF